MLLFYYSNLDFYRSHFYGCDLQQMIKLIKILATTVMHKLDKTFPSDYASLLGP